jgi:hypothetical protein
MSTLRQIVPPALAVGVLWFASSLYSLWRVPLSLPDIGIEVTLVLLLAAGIAIGLRWPGAAAAVAAGIAAVLGNLAARVPTAIIDRRPEGENMWFGMLAFASLAIAAHTVGTAAHHRPSWRLVRPA